MRVRDMIEALQQCDPDARVGVLCIGGVHDDRWSHTDIAVCVNGIGAMAEVTIHRTDDERIEFKAPGVHP